MVVAVVVVVVVVVAPLLAGSSLRPSLSLLMAI